MSLIANLTKQESVILRLVAKGWRNSRIASELSISIRTVETHLTNIFAKLNVNSRTEAALYVIRMEQARSAQMSRSHDDTQPGNHYSGT